MKGLFIKDLKLMKMQKSFFLIIIAVGIAMALFSEDASFSLGFLSIVIPMFTLGTISYDEFDNGNPFLFFLPITRAGYVMEKYGLGLCLGFGAWILSVGIGVISALVRHTAAIGDIMGISLAILPVMLVILALMLPFQLKFGGEKGRIAMLVGIGILAVLGFIIVKGATIFGIDLVQVFANMPLPGRGMLWGIMLAAAFILWLVSLKISVAIMNRKEF